MKQFGISIQITCILLSIYAIWSYEQDAITGFSLLVCLSLLTAVAILTRKMSNDLKKKRSKW